jgi:predicted dehydrogenase
MVPTIGVGILGHGFMGKAHVNAYRKLPYIFWPPTFRTELIALCGRDERRTNEAARRYGFAGYYLDWRELVRDKRVQLLDNCATHDAHAEPSIAALDARKHVLCEKPKALTVEAARRMRDAAVPSGMKHTASFNYRFAPAVRLARELVLDGKLGQLNHVRISYLQDWQATAGIAVPVRSFPSGVLLGLGSHVIDLARFLVGEPASVSAFVRSLNARRFVPTRSPSLMGSPDDDIMIAQVEFANGVLGTLEAAWICAGRKNELAFELNGTEGSLTWNLEDLNRLRFYQSSTVGPDNVQGFTDILVTEPGHPCHQHWWPPGHVLGWADLHTNLVHYFVAAIAAERAVEPWGATFEDGYRAAVISAAIVEASRSRKEVPIEYA